MKKEQNNCIVLQEKKYKDILNIHCKNISEAIELLKSQNKKILEDVFAIIRNTLDDTLEESQNAQIFDYSGFYSEISERLNLQALGYFIKEESTVNNIHYTSFTQREREAEQELDKTLNELLDKNTKSKIYSAIISYNAVNDEIQFSLGMKIGAKMAMMLLSDTEYDY